MLCIQISASYYIYTYIYIEYTYILCIHTYVYIYVYINVWLCLTQLCPSHWVANLFISARCVAEKKNLVNDMVIDLWNAALLEAWLI